MKKSLWCYLLLVIVLLSTAACSGGNSSDTTEGSNVSDNHENQLVGTWKFESGMFLYNLSGEKDEMDDFMFYIPHTQTYCSCDEDIEFYNDGTCKVDNHNYMYEYIYDGQAIVIKTSSGSTSKPIELSISGGELTLNTETGAGTCFGYFTKAN